MSNELNIIELLKNPLVDTGKPAPFLRLVLAEAAKFGMPPAAVATLDDIGAMLGFFDPLPKGSAAHIAGPITVWRTDAKQPIFERVADVEALALKQRCLIAYGGAPLGHQVGTAEIVCACGNLYREMEMPKAYYEIFSWASVDVLNKLMGTDPDKIRKQNKWEVITDDDVLHPGGRLHATYQEIATNIRRTTIAALENAPENPREFLQPLAAHFIRSHNRVLGRLKTAGGEDEIVARIEEQVRVIREMFPDLDPELLSLGQEAEGDEAA